MILIDKIRDNQLSFIEEVNDIALDLGINADWLMFVMYFESRLNPKAKNAYSGAVGLLQFLPSTAKHLGTSAEDLYNMTNVQQLAYVRKYLSPYREKMKSLEDVYLAVFFPNALGKSDDYILETASTSAEKIAKQNTIFDLNSDLKITKGEIIQYLRNWINTNKIELYLEQKQQSKYAMFASGLVCALLMLLIVKY